MDKMIYSLFGKKKKAMPKSGGNVLGGGGVETSPAPPTSSRTKGAKGASKAPAKTPEEQAALRAASLAAAEARGGAYDKKMGATAAKRAQAQKAARDSAAGQREGPQAFSEPSAESAARFAEAKRKEGAAVAAQGFNPYEPIFCSSTQAAPAVKQAAENAESPTAGSGHRNNSASSSSSSSSDGGSSSSGHRQQPTSDGSHSPRSAEVEADYEDAIEGLEALNVNEQEALENAFVLLASVPGDASKDAITTVAKLLNNLVTRFDDEKVHRMRLANKAIHAKVVSVPGGLEVLLAAGFVYANDDATDETLLVYPMVPQPEPPLLAALNGISRLQAMLA